MHSKHIETGKTSALIINDFGLAVLEPEDRFSLLEVLDARYRETATIIPGQISVSAWQDIVGSPR